LPHKYIISGGGTGGHIFPAVAIANELRRREPECKILFIGAKGRMEMDKIPAEGYEITGLDIMGLKRSLSLKNISVIWKFIRSYFKAKQILKQFNPDCVIGTGGYASLAVLYAAGRKKLPSLIWEGNGYAGLTNKILAKRTTAICTGLPGMEKYFPKEKIHHTGNPVRKEILNLPDRNEAIRFFGLKSEDPIVFITGGSLGARTINECIQQNLDAFVSKGIQLIWQTGKNFQADVQNKSGIYSTVFLREMNMAYAACDLVISRAGALSISEIAVAGKPSVLVPSPNVTDDHQTKNALKLTEIHAAVLIQDSESRQNLTKEILALLGDVVKMNAMKTAVMRISKPRATEDIVDIIQKIQRK